MTFRGLLGYQPHYVTQTVPGGPSTEVSGAINGRYQGAVQLPKYRFTGFVGYGVGAVSVDVVERWRSSVRRDADPNLVFADGKVASIAYTDLTLHYQLGSKLKNSTVFLSVQNLFDKSAPIFTIPNDTLVGWGGAPILYQDDEIGRYFTVGIHMDF
jgi:outer membrane receptor protein involved in Fe transport